VESGLLPYIRVGGLVRFNPAALRKLLEHDQLSATTVIERLSGGKR